MDIDIDIDGILGEGNGKREEGAPTVPHAESSADALARAKQRQHIRLAPSVHAACRGTLHPSSPSLIHPSATGTGLALSSLSYASKPRALPFPPALTPPREIWSTADGRWLIVFHPNPSSSSGGTGVSAGLPISTGAGPDTGGTLCVYPATQLLSPTSAPGTVIPLLSLPLPQTPLALQPLFAPRHHLPSPASGSPRRTLPLGPAPPPNLGSSPTSNGPTFLLLLPSALLLFYPQFTPHAPAPPGPSASQSNPTSMTGADGLWKMNFLRCPLHTRFRARLGELNPPDVPWRAKRGWLGLVKGDPGVWVGYEREGEIKVVRAEAGVDGKGAQYMEVVPMPSLPNITVPLFDETDSHQPEAKLQGVVFTALPQMPEQQRQGAGMTLIFHDENDSHSRSRLETVSFERVQVTLSDAFNEIESTSNEATKSWDWVSLSWKWTWGERKAEIAQVVHPAIVRTVGPKEVSIVALRPLPSLAPHNLALALLALPGGHALAYLTLRGHSSPETPSTESPAQTAWTTGPFRRVDIPDHAYTDYAELVISLGLESGLLGLVAITLPDQGLNPILVQPPPVPTYASGGETAVEKKLEERVAEGVFCAVKDERGYGEIVRAGLSGVALAEKDTFFTATLKHAERLFTQDRDVDAGTELARMQIAIFSATGDTRLHTASSIRQLHSASRIFDDCAVRTGKTVSFASQSLFQLYNVAEYVLAQLASVFRDLSLLSGEMEWNAPALPNPEAYPMLMLVSHPQLRRLLLGLLARVLALKRYLKSMREVPLDLALSMSAGVGAAVAGEGLLVVLREKGRALGQEEGLDIEAWGRALEASLRESSPLPEDDQLHSLLTLRPPPLPTLRPLISSILSQAPTAQLFMAQPELVEVHDGITFQPLGAAGGELGMTGGVTAKKKGGVRCERCGVRTAVGGLGMGGGAGDAGREDGWSKWIREREQGCVCGGSWTG